MPFSTAMDSLQSSKRCPWFGIETSSLTSLILLALVLPVSHAQSPGDIAPTNVALSSTSSTSTSPTQDPKTTPEVLLSMTTSFTPVLSRNTTTSFSVSGATDDVPPPLLPAGPEHSETHQDVNEGVFNYYFLILAVFGVFIAVGLWWVRRQRKRRKEQMRLSGQNALARDLDGWINTRRWVHGAWRHNQTAGLIRREEGLDERGEAPPPYQPKSEARAGEEAAGPIRDPSSGVTIPLRALSRADIEQNRPPEYHETLLDSASSAQHNLGPASSIPPNTVNSNERTPTGASPADRSTQADG